MGHGEVLKNILSIYESAVSGDISDEKSCVCVHGGSGSGKSKLLDQLKNTWLIDGANVFFYVNDMGALQQQRTPKQANAMPSITAAGPDGRDGAFRELVRQLARMYGGKDDSDFTEFITSYAKCTLPEGSPCAGTNSGGDGQHAYPGFGRDAIVKFIYDCAKAEPLIFIIDDLDKADNFTINFIGNLLATGALRFLVFSHADKPENKTLSNMLYRSTELIKYVHLQPDRSDSGSGTTEPDFGHVLEHMPVLDETILALRRPGKERYLVRHYRGKAEQCMEQMSYENAAAHYKSALGVLEKLNIEAENAITYEGGKSPGNEDIAMEIELLAGLGEAQYMDKQYKPAADSYHKAYYISSQRTTLLRASGIPGLNTLRIMISLRLTDCYSKLNMQDRANEHIMLTEAFFCSQQRRSKYYKLYKQHIPKYLYLLVELGEKVIFREKLKQAHSVCMIEDKSFAAELYFEESYLYTDLEDTSEACRLLLVAQKIADEQGCRRLWDDAVNALAILYEQAGEPNMSATLWNELISRSHDPVKTAGAMINLAIMDYERDGTITLAAPRIKTGIDLYMLAGEERMAADVRERLSGTPLAVV